jgi:prevent-host-death family protein
MKRISVSEAKDTLSACLARVRAGESVMITDRGRPVAVLSPVPADQLGEDERLASLARRGIVRLPRKVRSRAVRLPPLVRVGSPTAAVDAIREDRDD